MPDQQTTISDDPRPSATIRNVKDGSEYHVYQDVTSIIAEQMDDDTVQTLPAFDQVFVRVATVRAASRTDACWKVAEDQLRDLATSDSPPRLSAAATGRGGISDPKPYALETTVRRRTNDD